MSAEWDFSKLPEKEHGRIIDLLHRGKLWEIAVIHDQYNLSDNSYCCSNVLKGIKAWVEYGIATGQIRQVETSKDETTPEIQNDGSSPGTAL